MLKVGQHTLVLEQTHRRSVNKHSVFVAMMKTMIMYTGIPPDRRAVRHVEDQGAQLSDAAVTASYTDADQAGSARIIAFG